MLHSKAGGHLYSTVRNPLHCRTLGRRASLSGNILRRKTNVKSVRNRYSKGKRNLTRDRTETAMGGESPCVRKEDDAVSFRKGRHSSRRLLGALTTTTASPIRARSRRPRVAGLLSRSRCCLLPAFLVEPPSAVRSTCCPNPKCKDVKGRV